MSAKPIAVRGGRLRKRGGQVVSFAPYFADLMAGASRVAVGGALILSGVAALSPNSAMALDDSGLRCVSTDAAPNAIVCSGAADEDGEDTRERIYVSDADTTITTAAGFGIDVSNTEYFTTAISIYSGEDSDVSFTDENASTIKGNGTGLSIVNNGGAIDIETNGIIDGGNASLGEDGSATWSVGINANGGNGVAIDVADAGEIKANASSTLDISEEDASLFGEDSYNTSSSAAAVLTVQNGDADLSLTNEGSLISTSTIASNVSLVATDDVINYRTYNNVRSTGAYLNQQGLGALIVNNEGDITSTATATLDHQFVAEGGTGEDIVVYDNYVDINVAANGIIAYSDAYDDAEVNTDLSIINAGNITAAAAASGTIVFDATSNVGQVSYNDDNSVQSDVYSTAVSAYRDDDGNIDIENSAAIKSTAASDLNITFASDEYNTNPYYNRDHYVEVNSYTTGIDAYVGGDGNITIDNAGKSITASATNNLILNVRDSNGDGTTLYDSSITAYTAAFGVDAYLYDDGKVVITNSETITASAKSNVAFNGANINGSLIDVETYAYGIDAYAYSASGEDDAISITNSGTINASVVSAIKFSDDTENWNSDSEVISEAVGIYAESGYGDISIANSGTISATAVTTAVAGSGDEAVNLLEDDLYSDSIGFGIQAIQWSDGDISITNTVDGSITGSTAAIFAEIEDGSITITNNGTLANSSGKSDAVAIITGASSLEATGSVAITNNGKLTGTINTAANIFEFEGDDIAVSFADTIVNNGTWNTAGGTNEFGAGIDSVTNGEDGILQAANATFYGLETLTNNGTLTLANGVGGDVLYTTGNVVLNEGGNLVLDVSRNGSDVVDADGIVTINGGKLTLNSVGPRLTQGTVTLIEAPTINGDISNFDETNVENTVFLDLTLSKSEAVVGENQRIELTVERTQEFAAVAVTANQNAVAAALESIDAPESFMPMARGVLPAGNELLDEILYLPTEAAANDAFDQLSGEAHATLRSNLAEDSRLVRNSILTRLQNREGTAIWGEMFYGAGDLSQAKSRNTGNTERDAFGFILGADTNVAENVTVGLAASLINHDNEQQARNSKMEAETINLLAYVGVESGKARFKVGTGYAWTDVNTSRSVSFGRFAEKLSANYDASQFQAFAEVGYRLPLGGGYVEPVASIAYIDTTTDAFAEKGGLAALEGEKRSESTTVSNLGARFSTAKTGIFSVNGMAGWQHSFGNLIPTNVMNFAGSDSFTIAGAAQSRDAAVAQLEAKFDVGETTSLSLGYDGMLGNAGDHHAVKASVRLKF